ncbi:hypothetical protein JTB14_011641 [Gonioctena quinquepunctata]|nr:hypothetical protein JTB14_011641 [Gonioctena quinquepunctata]
MEPLLRARWPNKVAITAYADDIALAINADSRRELEELNYIGYISNKARSIFQSLRKFALPRWGNCIDSLKKIYQVAIIPIVGYASEVWLGKSESRQNKQKLSSMQCFCLRVILGAYKTVPNETACVPAKQLPIDLELKGRLAFSELRKTERTIVLGHEVVF